MDPQLKTTPNLQTQRRPFPLLQLPFPNSDSPVNHCCLLSTSAVVHGLAQTRQLYYQIVKHPGTIRIDSELILNEAAI